MNCFDGYKIKSLMLQFEKNTNHFLCKMLLFL